MRTLILTALLLCSSGVCLGETTDEMVKRKEATRERAKRIKSQITAPVPAKTKAATKLPLLLGEIETISGASQPTPPALSPSGRELTPFDLTPSSSASAGPKATPEVGFTTPAPTPKCVSPGSYVVGVGAPPGT